MHDTSTTHPRASRRIVLLLGGALAASLGLGACSRQADTASDLAEDAAPLPLERDDSGVEIQPPAPDQAAVLAQVSEDQDLANNSYVGGMGYYHTVSHTWYPYPFNWYYPGYGYYYMGGWHPTAYVAFFPSYSRPSRRSIIIYNHYHTVFVPGSSHTTTIIHSNGSSSSSTYFPHNSTIKSSSGPSPASSEHSMGSTHSSGSSSSAGKSSGSVARGGFGSSAHASSAS